jgi:hypothetical protein
MEAEPVQPVECLREQDVLDAVVAGQWPDRASDELRSHVAACEICSDVVDVVGPLLDDRDNAPHDAHIPSSAVMWWRAQMRARQEAAREAARPITVAQVVASAAAAVFAVVALVALSPWLRAWVFNLGDTGPIELPRLSIPATLLAQGWLLPALVMGLWLVLAPLALYFAMSDD